MNKYIYVLFLTFLCASLNGDGSEKKVIDVTPKHFIQNEFDLISNIHCEKIDNTKFVSFPVNDNHCEKIDNTKFVSFPVNDNHFEKIDNTKFVSFPVNDNHCEKIDNAKFVSFPVDNGQFVHFYVERPGNLDKPTNFNIHRERVGNAKFVSFPVNNDNHYGKIDNEQFVPFIVDQFGNPNKPTNFNIHRERIGNENLFFHNNRGQHINTFNEVLHTEKPNLK